MNCFVVSLPVVDSAIMQQISITVSQSGFMDNNIRIWFICFVVLFALSQLFDWVQQLSLPLPIYILGGAFLAVASNYEKLFGSYLGEYSGENSNKNHTQQQLDAASQPEVSIYDDGYEYVEEIEELEIRDLGIRE